MEKEQKMNLIRILASILLLAAAWILPLPGVYKLAAFLIPYILCGFDVLWAAAKNIAHGEMFDEKFLMSIATLGALALGDYGEAVAVMIFYQIGEWFQDFAVDRSRRDIGALMNLRPDKATVVRGEKETDVRPEEVAVGEIIKVRPGEKIPLDGVIVSGTSTVNTAALTGESAPRDLETGDRALSGTVNLSGVILIKTDSVFGQSTVSKVLELMETASSKKARAENFITRFSRVYTPCVVGAAALLAFVPPLARGQPFMVWAERALTFLVVSCPCALVVSVPLSFFGGLGGASKEGILIKGAGYLESIANVKTIAFDKTGTLTRGTFAVTAVHPKKVPEAELMDIAAVAESNSSHPIAQSIAAAHGGHIDKSRVQSVTEEAGLGVSAVIDGREIYVGNGKLMDKAGAQWHACHKAGTVIHLSEENEYLGHIVVADELKPDAKEAVAALKKLGVQKVVLLTGDTREVGEAVGRELGVDETRAGLLPQDKVTQVEKLLNADQKLCFVGDGINDAPVLARADVGVAMGALGSEAAIEAADIVLMDDKLMKLPRAILISRRTMRIVRQNIFLALLVKAVVLVLGALGAAGMWAAVFADVGVLILAVLNAMRALNTKRA